jgi:hypothetical protein
LNPALANYKQFQADMSSLLSSFGEQKAATTDDVAKTIYGAVTD